MDFSEALKAMKAGKKAWRLSWNHNDGYWLHIEWGAFRFDDGVVYGLDAEDLLATDWEIVEDAVPPQQEDIAHLYRQLDARICEHSERIRKIEKRLDEAEVREVEDEERHPLILSDFLSPWPVV